MEKNKDIRVFAEEIRVETLKEFAHLGFGHVGGAMSIIETLAVLYGSEMHIDPQNPGLETRDKFVMSKGHAGPSLYATLALKGYFPLENLMTLNQGGTTLPSHCDRLKTPGVDMTAGSLGNGLGIGLGMAYHQKLTGEGGMVYVILGDGELNEGTVWETVMCAPSLKTGNLVAIVDINGFQSCGACEDILPTPDLKKIWSGFGWNVLETDGHDMAQLIGALEQTKSGADVPTVILAKTVKGKGVSFMENNNAWHQHTLTEEQYIQAMKELEVVS